MMVMISYYYFYYQHHHHHHYYYSSSSHYYYATTSTLQFSFFIVHLPKHATEKRTHVHAGSLDYECASQV